MNEEQAKRQAAEAIRKQKLTEKAAEAGLKAIQRAIAEERRQAEAFREASKLCEDMDKATDLQADAWLCEVEANAMQAAAAKYAIAYAAIAGKPPKGAKDAKADKKGLR